jgi:hypothetical protein
MSNSEAQETILGRIRKLTDRIMGTQAKFDSGEFNTYGGAASLQAGRTELQALRSQLSPLRIIASGISCRACLHFEDVSPGVKLCRAQIGPARSTSAMRAVDGRCGPEARQFASGSVG